MNLVGIEKTTLLDYPGKVACTVFTAGCNFRCPYCYNRDLVLGGSDDIPLSFERRPRVLGGRVENRLEKFSEQEFFGFLEKRRGVLDAVVVCGGEPTLQPDLLQFLERIKSLDFLTKIDTNGSITTALRSAVVGGLIDYVALDVKAPLESEAYAAAVGLNLDDFETRGGLSTIQYSIELLVKSGVDFELRTTVVPGLHDKESLVRLASQLQNLFLKLKAVRCPLSAVRWFLQPFETRTCLDPEFDKVTPFSKGQMKEILVAVREITSSARLRGLG